jgi:hypothetical protein
VGQSRSGDGQESNWQQVEVNQWHKDLKLSTDASARICFHSWEAVYTNATPFKLGN